MSTADTITIIQAAMALLTCVLLVVYIIATHRLQSQSHEQSKLQQQQIDIAKQQLAEVLLRERLLFRPDLQWRGGYSSDTEAKWQFENLGADICNLRWSSPEGTQIHHDPPHMVRTFDSGAIHIVTMDGPLNFPLSFSLTYKNRFGETCQQFFEIATSAAEPRETGSA